MTVNQNPNRRPCPWCGLLNRPQGRTCWWCGLPLDSWPIKRRGAADRPREPLPYLAVDEIFPGKTVKFLRVVQDRAHAPAARPFHREEVGWGV